MENTNHPTFFTALFKIMFLTDHTDLAFSPLAFPKCVNHCSLEIKVIWHLLCLKRCITVNMKDLDLPALMVYFFLTLWRCPSDVILLSPTYLQWGKLLLTHRVLVRMRRNNCSYSSAQFLVHSMFSRSICYYFTN